MTAFAQRCGRFDAAAGERLRCEWPEKGIERFRVGFGDLHGLLRGKTLTAAALPAALAEGVGVVGSLLLKDTADRVALPLFEPDSPDRLPGFAGAPNLVLVPDPRSAIELPWAAHTGWLRGDLYFTDGQPVPVEPRRVLVAALERLKAAGYTLRCGLELEFHVYRIVRESLDPAAAEWPPEPPAVELVHPGWQLLGEAHADQADEVLALVQRTAEGLGLPLRSVEIELGPSQFEAVFEPCDALTAADRLLLFRNGVKQALRRAGYHASFVCRPPFANVMASGWHLHQSLVDVTSGRNAFVRDQPAGTPAEARHALSDCGAAWLAGLLAHARGMALAAVPTINGYGRFRPNALAPMAARWGRDNRGALLRVVGGAGDAATRIENRLGEPAANPHLCIAAQVLAGLDGLQRSLVPPPASARPYAAPEADERLPASLADAVEAFEADSVMTQGFGEPMAFLLPRVKRFEQRRHDEAADQEAWQRREYFSRY